MPARKKSWLLFFLMVLISVIGVADVEAYIDITGMTAWDSSHYPGRDAMQLISEDAGWEPLGPDTHTDDGPYMWLVDNVLIDSQWCIFDLNDVYVLQSVKIWNHNESVNSLYLDRGVRDMKILVADTISGLNYATPFIVTDMDLAPGNNYTPFGQVISLGGISGRYVKFDLDSCWGGYLSGYAGLSEVRFVGELSPPVRISNPSPADGAIDIAQDVILQWDAPTCCPGTVDTFYYEVYYGTEPDLAGAANITTSPGVTQAQPNPILPAGTRYYWRVDVIDPNGGSPATYTGSVYSFRTVAEPFGSSYFGTDSETTHQWLVDQSSGTSILDYVDSADLDYIGSTPQYVTSPNGYAMIFNGVDEGLAENMAYPIDMYISEFKAQQYVNAFTLEVRFMADEIKAYEQVIAGRAGRFEILLLPNGSLCGYAKTNGLVNEIRLETTTTVAAGQWHTVAFNWNQSGTYEIYLDGVREATVFNGDSQLDASGNKFTVAYRDGGSNYFAGKIDEIRFSRIFRQFGGTSDWQEIQDAINALPAEGGEVNLAERTYVIDRTIRLKPNLELRGAGMDKTIIRLAEDTNRPVCSAYRISNFSIKDLTLDGNEANNNPQVQQGSGVWLCAAMDYTIERVHIKDVDGLGGIYTMLFDYTYSTYGRQIIRDCIIENIKCNIGTHSGNGIYITSPGNNNFSIKGNIIRNCDKTGIFLEDMVEYIFLEGNEIYNNLGSGIWINESRNIFVHNNKIYNNGIRGIESGGSYPEWNNRFFIYHNTVYGHPSEGISFGCPDCNIENNVLIASNRVYGNRGTAEIWINANSTSEVSLMFNNISRAGGSATYGIRVDSPGNRMINNYVTGWSGADAYNYVSGNTMVPYSNESIWPPDQLAGPFSSCPTDFYVGNSDCSSFQQADLNKDCYVNLLDMAIIASDWLSCTVDNNPLCN